MSSTTLRLALLLTLSTSLAACGSDAGPAPETQVADLSESDAVQLCRDFFAGACDASYDPTALPCTTCDPCGQAATLATIQAECAAPITVGDVQTCMDAYDYTACAETTHGGCMFDVADALCPQ